MNDCLDTNTIVAIGSALEWKTDPSLRHLVECSRCQEQLRELTVLRDVLDATETPAADFGERVMASLAASGAPVETRSSVSRWLNPVLAALTTLFSVLLVTSGSPVVALGWPLVAVCAGVAASVLWWNHSRPSIPAG